MTQNHHYSFLAFLKDVAFYIRPYKKQFFIGVLFRVSCDIAALYPSFALAQVVSLINTNGSNFPVQTVAILLLLWFLAISYKSFSKDAAKYFGFQAAEKAAIDLYQACLKHIFRLDLAWQEQESSGNKMQKIINGREGINRLIRTFLTLFIEVAVNMVSVVIVFTTIQPIIGVAILFYIVTFYLLGNYLIKKPIHYEKESSKRNEDVSGLTFEVLNNVRTIKSLALERRIIKYIQTSIVLLIEQIRQRIFWNRTVSGILTFYSHFFEVVMVAAIVYFISTGQQSLPVLVLFISLFQLVSQSSFELLDGVQDVIVAKINVERAMTILSIKPEIEAEEKMQNQVDFPHDWQTMTVKNLHFTYEVNDILKNVSFSIKRGEKIGIVGKSGSGKTTLFKLLLDLYESYEGDILFDNVTLKNISRSSYIDHLSVVLQETELFNMSFKENITIAALPEQKFDQKYFDSIIQTAKLDDVVNELPKGVNTLIGEKGVKLSGGQRQRLGIARALYRKPDLLLLDEATSHLDVYSERKIQKALHGAFAGCTAIVIAHRLSTIREMDHIIVMDEGEIKEEGTFDELIASNGLFAKMWQEQTL